MTLFYADDFRITLTAQSNELLRHLDTITQQQGVLVRLLHQWLCYRKYRSVGYDYTKSYCWFTYFHCAPVFFYIFSNMTQVDDEQFF